MDEEAKARVVSSVKRSLSKPKKYVIVDYNQGVFLGTVNPYYVFANNDEYGIDRAYAFDTKRDAELFIRKHLSTYRDLKMFIAPVRINGEYAELKDLIEAGLSEYTSLMLDAMPLPTEKMQ